MSTRGSESPLETTLSTIPLTNATYLQKMNVMLSQFISILPKNVNSEGIMRLSGTKRVIDEAKQRYIIDPNQFALNSAETSSALQLADINDTTGMLKSVIDDFRPNPSTIKPESIAALKLFKEKMMAYTGEVQNDQPNEVEALIGTIAEHDPELAQFIYNAMYISRQIANEQAQNKMTEQNVAIAFLGPRLLAVFKGYLGETASSDDVQVLLQERKETEQITKLFVSALQLKQPASKAYYFNTPFADRYPNQAKQSAQAIIAQSKVSVADKPTPSADVDLLEDGLPGDIPEPAPLRKRSISDQAMTALDTVVKRLPSVGEIMKTFDLERKFNSLYKLGKGLFKSKNKNKKADIEIGSPVIISAPTHPQNESAQQSTGMPISPTAPATLAASDREMRNITKDNANSVLNDIDQEIQQVMKTVPKLDVAQALSTLSRFKTVAQELSVIEQRIPAKHHHRITPIRMDFADAKRMVNQKAKPIHGMDNSQFKTLQREWENKSKIATQPESDPKRRKP